MKIDDEEEDTINAVAMMIAFRELIVQSITHNYLIKLLLVWKVLLTVAVVWLFLRR